MATFEDGLNGSLGCILLVAFFSLMFYGCTCGQVMYYLTHYFTHDTGDHAYIKFTVILIWILDTGKTTVDMICAWNLLIFTHGDALALVERLPGIVPLLLALGSLAAGLTGALQIRPANSIVDAYSNAKITGALRPGLAAIVDVYITVWLCYHLQDAKTGYTHSDSMIAKLINYSITRGICTSLSQAMAFVLFLVDDKNKTLWSMIFYIPASTLYVNSLLAMWNGRRTVASPNSALVVPTNSESQGTWGADIPLESLSFVSPRSSMKAPSFRRHVIAGSTHIVYAPTMFYHSGRTPRLSRPSTLAGSSFTGEMERPVARPWEPFCGVLGTTNPPV
ncbi:hypothetical protein FOMPIDRAFT_1055727 [Fomitopsis schrenkii]|uniref:DUF6534 domain-containing protein n=1 Tax=Fomitopsis schrenkii TaxID=2126942 RepID=S8EVR6_FOMSC|nr:hypothetical protein FOMPIDRAFT_1055727 [Fomitopsis schrenkii]